jgi:hypothetical protein
MKFISRLIQRLNLKFNRDWRSVPAPNYRCSRGKQTDCKHGDYW